MINIATRRTVLWGLVASVSTLAMPLPAFAFSTAKAEKLIDRAVADINRIIGSGKGESAMLRDFEQIFVKYADVRRVAQMVLGADGRSASAAQKSAFAKSFQGYISRKYGKRFREFIGGQVVVNNTRAVKSYYEVKTTAHLQGSSPFEVVFVVADSSGRFIDMKVEGISLVKAERTEIGAMLDKRKGDLNRLISDLKRAG